MPKLTHGLLAGAALVTLLSAGRVLAQQAGGVPPQSFGASYDTLSGAQKALLDGIYERAGRILNETVNPADAFERAPLSTRTTFDAVTNALLTSTLTDRDTGASLGTPIDLIDHLEAVNGQIRDAPGDQQFRLYVALTPGAEDLLARSKEFRRTADNTVFHKGYPRSYRQDGYPSIQFSIAEDGSRADIDVDYRSSSFPVALFNGHLTASNSDVRAGNYERHTGRWSGLVNWWEGLLSSLFAARIGTPADTNVRFPVIPRAGTATIDVAVRDFLTSWLVEKQPNLAVAYVAPEAYDCLALRLEQDGETLDRGLARLQMYTRMKAVSDAIGPRESLDGTTVGVRLVDPNLTLVRQDEHAQFVLFGVPEPLAARMTCGAYSTMGALPEVQVSRFRTGPFQTFYSTLFVVGPTKESVSLGLLWQQRDGNWKIVAYQTALNEAEDDRRLLDVRPEVAPVEMTRVSGDPALLAANEQFADAWLVRKQYNEAFGFFSPRSYACVNLYLNPGEPVPQTPGEQRDRLRAGMERIGDLAGPVERLEDIMRGVEPVDPRVRLIDHPRQAAFGLFQLPDWAGPATDCEARIARGDQPAAEGTEQTYGQYAASAFQFKTLAGEAAVFYLGWTKDGGRWRIYSFKVDEP